MIVYVCVTQWMFPLSINMHGFKWSCTNLSWCLVRQYVASNNTNVPCEALNGFRNGTYSVFWPNRMCKENTVVVILLRDIANGLWKTDSAYILQCINRKQCWGDEFRFLHYIMCIKLSITCSPMPSLAHDVLINQLCCRLYTLEFLVAYDGDL